MKEPQPTPLPEPVRYHGGDVPVQLGDHVEVRSLFWWKGGRVTYVPGISPTHPELEFNGLMWACVDFYNGTRTGILVDPETGKLLKQARFVRRDPEGFSPLRPDDSFDE
jgi:hypothetical protein